MNRDDYARIAFYLLIVVLILSFAYFLGFTNYLIERLSSLQVLDFSQTIYNYTSVIAIIVGATWAYSLFIKNREQSSRVELEHFVSHFPYSKASNVLHVEVRATNIGKVLITVSKLEASVFQLFPLPKKVRGVLLKEYGVRKSASIATMARELPWEKVAFHEGNFQDDGAVIEPGENQEFLFDFVVNKRIRAVSIYSFLYGPGKGEYGWEKSTNYYIEGSKQISQIKRSARGKRSLTNRVASTKLKRKDRR